MAELAEELDMIPQHVRHHLLSLEKAGLVTHQEIHSRNRNELVKQYRPSLSGLAAKVQSERERAVSMARESGTRAAPPSRRVAEAEAAYSSLVRALATDDSLTPAVEVSLGRVAQALGILAGRAAELRYGELRGRPSAK